MPLDAGGGGPALHVGMGGATPLNDSSLFFEVVPSLVVGRSETTAVFSARAGIIF